MVSAATYVRPIAYFLGLAIGVFMVYFSFRTRIKRVLIHALVFLLIIYSLLGLWHFHNYKVAGKNTFTDMVSFVPGYRNYIIRDDEIVNSLSPIPRYLNIASRSFVSLMTRPATLKAFNSPTLKRAEKIFEYPWIVFWFLGFLVGISKIEKSIYLQFLSYVAFYFICATVAAISFGVSSRQRAPLMPFIAILSAYGWTWIISTLKSRQQKAYDNG
jgi:hypothetical protein